MNPCNFHISCYGITDKGSVRKNNEDVFLTLLNHNFFALADGMGGHNAGEIAAQESVLYFKQLIIDFLKSNQSQSCSIKEISEFKKICFSHVNTRIHQLGKAHEKYAGMGTTLCTALFYKSSLIYGHVGDSRIYRLRSNGLQQLTSDHSLINHIKNHNFYDQNNQSSPRHKKNILTRAIGTQVNVKPEISIDAVLPNDVYLICSDGLSNQVSDSLITETLQTYPNLKEASTELINKTKSRGGLDNSTLVLIKIHEKKHQQHFPR